MRYWNIHDEELWDVLRTTIVDQPASFEIGPDGGVAVFFSGQFIGIWIERVRGLHSYVPAGYLEPTHVDLAMGEALTATKLILERARQARPRLRLIA